MNILIPDKWLREYLDTNATPKQIKEYVSLSGPSIERLNKVGSEIVYDVEVTTNRPDAMSVVGIAREAAAILPRFGVAAQFINDPYQIPHDTQRTNKIIRPKISHEKALSIKTDTELNPRWISVVLTNVTVSESPQWLKKYLELTGIRSLNTVVDITNYLMRAFGQPAHAFDYDEILPGKNKVPTMILRKSRKGEKITTLDGKTHTLPGDDIVIEDGSGRLIDLCGIMGAQNSSIKNTTTSVVLFIQTYDPVRIRKTSMNLAHRTEAATLFEKGLDSELVLPAIIRGVELMQELCDARQASKLHDEPHEQYRPPIVQLSQKKLNSYIGTTLENTEIKNILESLGMSVKITSNEIAVKPPSFRRDIQADVDIIEEIARLYGYHTITPALPSSAPPMTIEDPLFKWEEAVKIRLRDWGFIETYTYSMISEELMDASNLNKEKSYKIANPFSSEWVYMRPSLLPSILTNVKENLHHQNEFKIFELSMVYEFRQNQLPNEQSILMLAWTGEHFYEAKGIAQSLLELFGISFKTDPNLKTPEWYSQKYLPVADVGHVGEVSPTLLASLGIKSPVTILELDFEQLVAKAQPTHIFKPIPKYPPIIEDLSFTFEKPTPIGEVMHAIRAVSNVVYKIQLVSQYESTSSFRIEFLKTTIQITAAEVAKIRSQIIDTVSQKFSGQIKTI